MKGTLPAISGVLPGKAITRQKGAINWVHRSWRVLCSAVLVAVLTVLALLPGAGQTRARAAAPPAFSPAIQRQLQQALDQTVANPQVPGAIVGLWVPARDADERDDRARAPRAAETRGR